MVPSFFRSAQWLPFCKNKYLKFLEFEILQQVNSPPLMCFNCSQPRLWNYVLHQFNVPNPLVPPLLRSGQWLKCCRHKYLQFSEFEILRQLHSPPFMCFNYSQPRLLNHVLYPFDALNPIVPSSLRSGQSLQRCKNKYLQFSEFEIQQQVNSPPLMCSKYCPLGIWNDWLDIFNELDLFVPSILRSHGWLWLCRHKYPEFSEFEILPHMCSLPWILSHYSQPGIVGPLIDLFNVTNLVVQSFLWSNDCLRCCTCKQPQFSEFEIIDHMCSIPCIPSHYSQSGISNRSLHQLNALNRLVASVSQSHSWL